MARYIFKKLRDSDNPYDQTDIKLTVDTESLSGLLEEINNFLRCAGFVFDGELEIVDEDEGEWEASRLDELEVRVSELELGGDSEETDDETEDENNEDNRETM